MDVYLDVLKNKYAQFDGRAGRREYWMFFLINILISFGVGIIDGVLGLGFLGIIYALAVLVPGIAIAIRRLHDVGKPGWWILLFLIPLVGFILWIIFMIKEGDPGANEYGAPVTA